MNNQRSARDGYDSYLWYRSAAERGDPYAQFNLGLLYKHGRGVARDDRQAAQWFLKAALRSEERRVGKECPV